jgi:hypothetical protein
MTVIGELLFYRRDQVDLDAVLRHQVEQLRGKVDALPADLFSKKSDEEIAKQIAEQEALHPLTIDFNAGKASVRECVIEVHDQFGFERGPVRVQGLAATKSFPFNGDPELWHLRTNPWGMNPPRGDVQGNDLVIGIEVRANEADQAARYIDETVARIPEYLQRQEAQIAKHNASLAMNAMRWISLRRQRLGTASDLLKKLNSTEE